MDKSIHYRRVDREYKYRLVRQHRAELGRSFGEVTSGGGQIRIRGSLMTIQSGYMWDGPSGPTFDTPNFMRGSLVHDCFYQLMREKKLPLTERDYTDRLIQQMCREDGMTRFRAWLVYRGLKNFGKQAAQPKPSPKTYTAP